MTQSPKLYLSGPDVFLPNANAIIAEKVKLAQAAGFQVLIPGDDDIARRTTAPPVVEAGGGISREIYAFNVAAMREADFAICQLTPFRGPSADVGTVFELGMMIGLGKPVFAYTNSNQPYLERIGTKGERPGSTPPAWSDVLDCSIENFGNCDNLMLDGAIAASSGGIVAGCVPMARFYTATTGFAGCLEAAQLHYGLAAPAEGGAAGDTTDRPAFAFDH